MAIWNRTPERAQALARDLGVRAVERPEAADLIVNATSIGLRAGDELPDLPAPPQIAVDLVYRPGATTPFAEWARRGEARVIDGLEVLVRQGALSFERWTGRAAPIEVMRQAARGH